MSESEQRFANFFLLRAVLSIVVLALLFYHHQQGSPALWMLATIYLASNLVLRALPARRFEDPSVSYGLFFVDIAILTVIYYASGSSSSWLFLFYLTILMATLGETVPKSVGVGFGVSALYIWTLGERGVHVFEDHEALLPIPLFLVTATLCGYLAREVRHYKRQVRSLKDIQRTLELRIGRSSEDLAQSEDLRIAAQELAQRFRNLVEDLNAGIWEMEVPSLKITFVSHQMEAILGRVNSSRCPSGINLKRL
jgi:K+-sensing histidine kinase KdpD